MAKIVTKLMKKLNKMQVKKRLTVSFVGVVAVSSIAAVLALVLLFVMDYRYSKALVENGFIQGDLGEYNAYLNKSGAFVRDVIMLDDPAEVTYAEQSLKESDEKVQYYLEQFEAKLENDEERALTALIEEKYPQYIKLRDEAISFSKCFH